MVCKKCGYGALIQDGDWLKCPNCGAEYFNTKIDFGISARDEFDDLDKVSKVETDNDINKIHYNIKEDTKVEEKITEPTEEPQVEEVKIPEDEKIKEETIENEEISEVPTNTENSTDVEDLKEQKKKAKKEKKEKAKKDKPKKEKKDKKEKPKKEKKAKKTHVSVDGENDDEEEKPKSKFKDILDFITPIVIAVIVALLLKSFVFANAVVPTPSMLNTIKENDRIIASRLAYIKDDPQRYDIVMFNYPDDESVIYVKRIIGLPGETVTVVNGVAFVQDMDGKLYQTDTSFVTNEIPKGDFGPFYIPFKGEKITTDGEYCYAENGIIVGKTEFINKYCKKDKQGNSIVDENGNYIVDENCYFCMGDNRNHSLDSRYWDNTYVAQNKILGKVLFRYYPKIEQLK